jgi:two-component system, sporulation sensor kinase E
MSSGKSNFLDKVLGRIGRLDADGLQTVVQRLARERSFLETLFNTIEDGVLVVDEDGRILYFNHAVTEILGLEGKAVEGQSVSKHLPQIDWKQLSAFDRRGGQKVVRHEFEISYPSKRFLRLYTAPLDGEASGSSGMVLIFHDATEARARTFEAIESQRIQALTLLAASVAHEIGNPLHALSLHLQLMERQIKKLKLLPRELEPARNEPKARFQERLTQVKQETGEIAGRLDEFLAVAKGEIGRLDYIITQFLQAIRPVPPRLRRVSLNDAVRETVELLRPEFDNRGQTIEKKLAGRLPEAQFDLAQIKQALVNLARNAMQAMGKGGVLTIETGATEEEVWVGLLDTGRGIPPEQMNRIFEPFFTTKKKGSGLGLMIVQRIMRAHNGRIELDSREGRGTMFRMWLPLPERETRLLKAGRDD